MNTIREESDSKLNTLCYQILGVLLRQPQSGYDIVKQLHIIRQVKTSQVYPTLARLEKRSLVTSERIEQQGRPDKRVYSVTPEGETTLKNWVGTEPEPPVLRDEFLTMIYSAWTKEPAEVIRMLGCRLEYLSSAIEALEKALAELHAEFPEELKNPRDWRYYRNALILRRLAALQQEVIWARTLIHQLQHTPSHQIDASQRNRE